MTIALAAQKLDAYQHTWLNFTEKHASFDVAEEVAIQNWFRDFVTNPHAWFERSNHAGHFTASALVTNRDMTKVLLTHHKKLNMWLQLGGHADGNPRLHNVAQQEVSEESGMHQSEFVRFEHLFGFKDLDFPLPFDLDRHLIPARKGDPEHYHYDVRFLMTTDEKAPDVSEESHDVKWLSLAEARTLTNERSMHRQFDKLEFLRQQLLV